MIGLYPVNRPEWTEQARAIGHVTLRQLEELTELQLRVARSYADLGALQLRGAATVRDWNSLQTFLRNQRTVGARFSEKLAHDVRSFWTLSARITEPAKPH